MRYIAPKSRDAAPAPTKKRRRGYQPVPVESLPTEFRSPDATIQEVMAYRRESARTVWRKIADGTYESYKSRDSRLILWSSVFADRDRCLRLGPQLLQPPVVGKRKPGRPRKTPETKALREREP